MMVSALRSAHSIVKLRLWLSFLLFLCAVLFTVTDVLAKGSYGGIYVPINRAELITTNADIGQVIVANPNIADVYAHGLRKLSIIGKDLGRTNVRIFDKQNNVIRAFDVDVGYDLPAIRRALWQFLKDEPVAVEMINSNIVLTGDVSNAAAAEKAVKIVEQFTGPGGSSATASATAQSDSGALPTHKVLNLIKVVSGQQVMLRVRVGEIKRAALKRLGTGLQAVHTGGKVTLGAGTGGGLDAFDTNGGGTIGQFTASDPTFSRLFTTYDGAKLDLGLMIEALEQDGLFKVLAEPNLVAMSGEEAEFLAGGEFPIPVAQGSGGGTTTTVEFKPYGIAVKFVPFVLTENRVRITVQPEVSEIDRSESTSAGGAAIPGVTTRRAKTTVELAPGESFMIAGLLSDRVNTNISEVPGIAEIPVLSALFRSTDYQRNETELVIAVTPYIVDPLKSSDVRLPTDNFRTSTLMERVFYGALGSLSGNADRISQNPSLEGPIGYMTD
jgi:pilus assembly protein CpaC